MEEIKNELTTIESKGIELVNELTNAESTMLITIPDDGTRESKTLIYNAVSNTDYQLSDCIGSTIDIVDVIAHLVDVEDPTTGEVKQMPRIILIDKDHKSYACVSMGIYGALQRMFAILGTPSWAENPVSVKVSNKRGRKGFNFLTLEMV